MKTLFFLFLILFLKFSFSQESYSVYLIGDAGNDTIPGKALQFLSEKIKNDSNSTVLFLGDNVYPEGLILDSSPKGIISQKKLLSQLSTLKSYKGNVFFIPGNHDWASGKREGIDRISNQAWLITHHKDHHNIYFPSRILDGDLAISNYGEPGPNSFMLTNNTRLIIIDTQWFLHQRLLRKVNKHPGLSYKETKEKCFHDVDSILRQAKLNNEIVLIAAHHPLVTNGRHSKKRQPLRFINNYTPVQLLGLLGANRFFVQDIYQPAYNNMRKRFLEILSPYQNVIYVCGHDHDLEYIKYDNLHEIISGSGSKLAQLNAKQPFPAQFQNDKELGFFKLIFLADKQVEIQAWGAETKSMLYSTVIFLTSP